MSDDLAALEHRDDDLVGRVLLMVPSMQLLEVLTASRLFDIAMVEKLDMEGGRTGRNGMIPPSRMIQA